MATSGAMTRNPAFGYKRVRKQKAGKMQAWKSYQPARFRTPAGLREEIPTFDHTEESPNVEAILAVPSFLELRADLNKAFSTFSRLEQRILVRVLVQGQSVAEAVKHFRRRGSRTWERWMTQEALPRLRTLLGDYYENGKVVL
jgi:hypothetical protein